MSTILIDGLNEEDFRRSIENRLREGRSGAAVARLRALLVAYAGPGGILPERFLTVGSADLLLTGWDSLGEAVSRHDRPGSPITAVSIALGWPGEEGPELDADGGLRPHLETSYFNDDTYPFSQSQREDLLDGYTYYGCTWSGDSEATDAALALEGIDDLHGALARLEARLLDSDEPDDDALRAGSLGACLISALLVQAVNERIARDGLPRPLCVMAGSNGVYPYFDAPVAGMPEPARELEATVDAVVASYAVPAPRYSSLAITGIPRGRKRAVLVLDESEDDTADRLAKLRTLHHGADEEAESLAAALPNDLAAVQPEWVEAEADNRPLLATKPARKDRNLHSILGLHAVDLSPTEAPRPDLEREEPSLAVPRSRKEWAVGPGFTLFADDLQQRLESPLSAYGVPLAEHHAPAPPVASGPLDERWTGDSGWPDENREPIAPEPTPPEAIVLAETPVAPASLRARLGGVIRGWLARLGQ